MPTDPGSVPVDRFELDDNVIKGTNLPRAWLPTDLPNTCPALPMAGLNVLSSEKHARSFWGPTAKIVVELPEGGTAAYFLKVHVPSSIGPECPADNIS